MQWQENNTKASKLRKKIQAPLVQNEELPEMSSGSRDEQKIFSYIGVLRKAHEEVGNALQGIRFKNKSEKKLQKKINNPNFLKNIMFKEKKKNSLKRKIRKMRNMAIFPQPKSYMNYSKRKGLLKKNSIKIT